MLQYRGNSNPSGGRQGMLPAFKVGKAGGVGIQIAPAVQQVTAICLCLSGGQPCRCRGMSVMRGSAAKAAAARFVPDGQVRPRAHRLASAREGSASASPHSARARTARAVPPPAATRRLRRTNEEPLPVRRHKCSNRVPQGTVSSLGG